MLFGGGQDHRFEAELEPLAHPKGLHLLTEGAQFGDGGGERDIGGRRLFGRLADSSAHGCQTKPQDGQGPQYGYGGHGIDEDAGRQERQQAQRRGDRLGQCADGCVDASNERGEQLLQSAGSLALLDAPISSQERLRDADALLSADQRAE